MELWCAAAPSLREDAAQMYPDGETSPSGKSPPKPAEPGPNRRLQTIKILGGAGKFRMIRRFTSARSVPASAGALRKPLWGQTLSAQRSSHQDDLQSHEILRTKCNESTHKGLHVLTQRQVGDGHKGLGDEASACWGRPSATGDRRRHRARNSGQPVDVAPCAAASPP